MRVEPKVLTRHVDMALRRTPSGPERNKAINDAKKSWNFFHIYGYQNQLPELSMPYNYLSTIVCKAGEIELRLGMRNGAWWAAAEIFHCEGTREKTIGRCLLLHHIDLYNSESFFLHDHKRVVIYSTRWYVDLESSEPANKREVHLSLNCSWLVIKITIGRFKSKGIMQSKKKLPGDTMDVIPWVSITSITYRATCKWD